MVLPESVSVLLENSATGEAAIVLGVFLVSIIAFRIFKYSVVTTIKRLSRKTKTELDDLIVDAVEAVHWPFYILLAVYIALHFTHVPAYAGTAVYFLLLAAATYYIVIGIGKFIDYSKRQLISRREREIGKSDTTLINTMARIVRAVVWLLAALFFLSNLGYDISTFIAGLGIGGIAIAFALQNVLGDIFASFSIYFDKPFRHGDFIIVGDDMGVVKKIGIKSTRIQTLRGEELVVSNKELTETRIHNYKKMQKRRIAFAFGVTYETPTAKMKKIPSIVTRIMSGIELATLDRVHFKNFGDFSLNYEVVYYLASNNYNKYMDVQQQINLSLKAAFEKEKIGFAYPTQTIMLTKAK
jgi:small-conductance mechanosensitive channel